MFRSVTLARALSFLLFCSAPLRLCAFALIGVLVAVWSMLISSTGLAADPPQVDVFTAGEGGYHTFRIPALVVTKKGTLLAICEGRKTGRGDHGDVDLVVRRSTDGGKTWGPLQLIYEEGDSAKITIGNPCPVADLLSGRVLLPFTRDNDHVLITVTHDEGKTWLKPVDLTVELKENDWSWYATGPGNGIQLTRGEHAGRLVVPCDHRVGGTKDDKEGWDKAGRSHVIYSDNNGQTWKLGGSTDFAMNECAVVELPDGTLMLNSRSYRGKACRGISLSKDGGATWEPTTDDPALVESVCQASLIRCRWTGEQREPRDVLLFCNPAVPKGRHHLTIRMSDNSGKTWTHSRLICEDSSAYSSLAQLADGEIGLLYERNDYKQLTFTRFPLSWVTETKDAK